MENLRVIFLNYIGYVLPFDGHYFSYDKFLDALKIYDTDFSITTIRKEYSNLKTEKLIEFKLRYRKPYPVLTQKGRLEAKTKLKFKHFDEWDKIWRMVIFDIPEHDKKCRYQLKEKLNDLGFLPIARSAYVCPHKMLSSVTRFCANLGIKQYVKFFEICEIFELKNALEQWQIDQINDKYADFIKKAQIKNEKLWPLEARKLESEFSKIYDKDPHLPPEILPQNWYGQQAYKKFKQIVNSYK